ncbi:MAG: ribosome maturation factor RimP [Lachnospiraceae bacterium]
MSKRDTYEAKFEQILMPITEKIGVQIYDVEYVKEGTDWYLRAYIDKEGGVTIDDCEKVSRAVSEVMDQEDFIEDAYILEVSSPGLGRTLKKDKHLEKSIGQKVEIKTYKPIEKQKEFSGVLEKFDSESITISLEETEKQGDVKKMTFARGDVALIRLAFDF